VYSTATQIVKEKEPKVISIGQSLCNTLTKVEKGLLLQGKSVGWGYNQMQRTTRQKFVYDYSRNDGQSKMYDSGDQARYLETGDIEYLGRNDDQVKINGQRVELGAVESGLLSCKGVMGCAVIVTGDTNKSLAAFVVLSEDAKTLATERSLKEQVSKKVARSATSHRSGRQDSAQHFRQGRPRPAQEAAGSVAGGDNI
jgi:acyl-coenzyme A synthetase/AMP-(fatty) acid ligase